MNFQQSPWGYFRKREGGGLINAGPPEALSLKAFFRHRYVFIVLLGPLGNTGFTSSVRVDPVRESMEEDDSLRPSVHKNNCNTTMVWIGILTS